MTIHKQKGFTLIELLIVIAIIGILSSVVLASINTARTKGANAAVKSNLANMRTEASLWYDSNLFSYSTFCTDPVYISASTSAAIGATSVTCVATTTMYAIMATFKVPDTALPTGKQNYFCVDSNGYSGGTTSPTLSANLPSCN